MLIATQKRKENITEYILYLYQVEELIRAFHLDMDLIEKQLVSKYRVEEKTSREIRNWYSNLVLMMEKEGIRESGHLQFLVNQINELNRFHLKLMETAVDGTYVAVFQTVAGLVAELKQKHTNAGNDIQVSLDAIYGYLLLKIQKKEISVATADAVKRISQWLGLLSKLYKDFEAGDLEL
jgi:hypothetical protein